MPLKIGKAAAGVFQVWSRLILLGSYLTGESVSLADLSLAPKLYHLKVTLDHFHPDTLKKARIFISLYPFFVFFFLALSHPLSLSFHSCFSGLRIWIRIVDCDFFGPLVPGSGPDPYCAFLNGSQHFFFFFSPLLGHSVCLYSCLSV